MSPSTRAVLYVGYACNIKCQFCYYKDRTGWRNLSYLQLQVLAKRFLFGDDRVDITGGEPTVYPRIVELVRFCSRVGLRPSLITNGIALASEKKVLALKEAGVYDYLISCHGLGEVYNYTVDVKKGFDIQQKGIQNLRKHGIPFRSNVTITKFNYEQLPDIARHCVEIGSRVVNFISFNPFADWEEKIKIDFQARHSEIAPYLREALDVLNESGVEANVRYFPFCMLKGYERHQQNFLQVIYDSHEWDYASSLLRKNPLYFLSFSFAKLVLRKSHRDLEKSLLKQGEIARKRHCIHTPKCETCTFRGVCDGLTHQYWSRFGDGELEPYRDSFVPERPDYFMRQLERVVD